VLEALLFLARHLLVHLLFGPHFLIIEVLALLLARLVLLLLDQSLDHRRLGHVLVVLMIKEVLVLSLLAFRVAHVLPNLLIVRVPLHHYLLALLLLLRLVDQGHLGLLVHLLLQPHLLLLLDLHVPSALRHDVACLLASLVNFLVCAQLLLLQQVDSVCQQLQVFLRSLSSDLSCHQLAVQRLVVVLLVRR